VLPSIVEGSTAGEGRCAYSFLNPKLNPDLHAFGGDIDGSKLPNQFEPWERVGVVELNQAPPYKLPRDVIERAMKDQGFQLFCLSKAE